MLWPTLLLLLLIIFPLWDYLRRKKHHDQLPQPPAGPSSLVNVAGNVLRYRGSHDERIMAHPLQNVPKYGSKYHTWMCDNPNKFLTTDARDVFSETFFKVFPLVFPATALATKLNAEMNRSPYMIDAHNILEVTDLLTVQRMDWINSLLGRRQEVLIQTLHDFTTTVCGLQREQLQMQQLTLQLNNDCEYDELEQKRRLAMWEMLLLLQGMLRKEETEEDTLLTEDSSRADSGLLFCLYEISGQSAGQEGMDNESDKVLDHDKKHSMPVLHCLNELECLECVVKESLHPTVSTFGCNLKEYMEMQSNLIPVGTNITVGIYALLRDPHEYEARRRHEEQSEQKQFNQTNPFANVLFFSAGPRVLEMRSAISKVLQSYKLLALPASPRAAMSPFSINGIHLS